MINATGRNKLKLNRFKAIIFDMDGLLVDSEPLWTKVDEKIISQFGRKFDTKHKHTYMGMAFIKTSRLLVEKYNLPLAPEKLALMRIEKLCEEFQATGKPMPGAQDALEYFSQKNKKLALATSSRKNVVEVVLKKFGWRKYFSAIVTGPEVKAGKPAPDIYLEAAERMKIEPDECLVLEDSLAGAQSAKAAGMTVIAVVDKRFNNEKNYQTLTDYIYLSLPEFLKGLGNW